MLLIFAGMGRHMKMLGMNFYCDGQNIDTKTSGIIHINIGVHNYFWSEAVFDTEQCSKKPLLYLWGQNPWKSLWWRLFFSKKHLKKDVFCVIFLWYSGFFKNTQQKWFRVISLGLLQYLIK